MLKRLQAMRAKKGFTLVELIVVIVIIAILAAILIPILVNHVAASRCSQAIGNCKTSNNLASEAVVASLTAGDSWATAQGLGDAAGTDTDAKTATTVGGTMDNPVITTTHTNGATVHVVENGKAVKTGAACGRTGKCDCA